MMLRLKFIYSLFFIAGLCSSARAQDSVLVDTKQSFVYVKIDYGKLLESAFGRQLKWELGVGAVFADHFNIIAEYGYGELNPPSVINNGSYTSEGNYLRGGIAYIVRVMPQRFLSFGLLYAYSGFKDKGVVEIESDIWDNLNQTFQRDDLSAQWIEIVIGTEAPILRNISGYLSNIYWGSELRTRIMMSETATQEFDIYAVPGFGRRYNNVVPAINLYLKFKFPIKG